MAATLQSEGRFRTRAVTFLRAGPIQKGKFLSFNYQCAPISPLQFGHACSASTNFGVKGGQP